MSRNKEIKLPDRYAEPFVEPFIEKLVDAIRPGSTVLDVGAGRSPLIKPALRPIRVKYVGLDISEAELELAGEAYDERIVGDICDFKPELAGIVDVAVSWQVLEHVRPLPAAVENIRQYLRPGGVFLSQLSGGLAFFAIANRLLPHAFSKVTLSRLLGRDPETVFPAHYHYCTRRGLEKAFDNWAHFEVEPHWLGAGYLKFSPSLQRSYAHVEDFLISRGWTNLAPYYSFVAAK